MHFICNKCFATTARGKKPYSLTGCGHIYCYLCVNEARKQCPQCKCTKSKLMTITESFQQQSFFQPLQVHINNLIRAVQLHKTQQEIVQHRFEELDKKYTYLKERFCRCEENNKILMKKFEGLQEIRRQEQKRMTLLETRYRNLVSPNNTFRDFKTPSTRNTIIYKMKCNASNQSSKYSAQNVHPFITPVKSSQRTVETPPSSDMSLSRLNINTPRKQLFMNSPYFRQNPGQQ